MSRGPRLEPTACGLGPVPVPAPDAEPACGNDAAAAGAQPVAKRTTTRNRTRFLPTTKSSRYFVLHVRCALAGTSAAGSATRKDPMSYVVLARKWRPMTFEDLVGQEHVSRTLGNAIQSGRVAHAFLFTGVRGVGKTTAARILAKALNCTGTAKAPHDGPTARPCLECAA